jgi:hypothetical protein
VRMEGQTNEMAGVCGAYGGPNLTVGAHRPTLGG